MRKAQALTRLRRLPGWALAEGGKAIRRDYLLKDFLAAAALIRRIAARAQAADHHPDLHLTGYRRLKVVLTTHSAGGLTLKDFRLAAEIEVLSAGRRGAGRSVPPSPASDRRGAPSGPRRSRSSRRSRSAGS